MRQEHRDGLHDDLLALFAVLGRRWALRVLWELRDGPLTYRLLLARCGGMSSSVLTHRLRELRAEGFVVSTTEGYALTVLAQAGLPVMGQMQAWAKQWRATTGAGAP